VPIARVAEGGEEADAATEVAEVVDLEERRRAAGGGRGA